ncbi:MAG: SpoIIE family protein phosphatase [Bacteroidetes bacterium]|nr:SpoIIE family protein phosphatase [Bacteroidota bacterium]
MKLRQRILLLVAVASLVLDTVYVFVQHAITSSGALEGDLFHTALVLLAFGGGGWYAYRAGDVEEQRPMQLIGRTMLAGTLYLLLIGIVKLTANPSFTEVNGIVAPASFSSLMATIVLAIGSGVCAIVVFTGLSRLVFVKRRKSTRRNYAFLLTAASGYVLLAFISSPNGFGVTALETVTLIVSVLALIALLLNAFHFSWILMLSRREKLITLLLAFFGFIFFIILSIYAGSGETVSRALQTYHPLLSAFVNIALDFGALSMGIGFVSTLLHLPTAKEFDRKKMEISTLQNMSRLITQVFDFDELMATTTHLALEVSEGHAAWLELINGRSTHRGNGHGNVTDGGGLVGPSLKNITAVEIGQLCGSDGKPLRELMLEAAHPVLVQDFVADLRLDESTRKMKGIGAMVLVPLSSHGEITGLLCVTRKEAFSFDKDAVNVLSAFADMVSVAIENSTLIRESIVKERMEQELLVAQQMQQSLLPQQLPAAPHYDIAARSIPAYEVGGDYYDVLSLDGNRIGFVVGDVSGKGVSAALYMAQVKGIFQSLSRDGGASTRDILVRMNTPLCESMERKSFISLLYAVLDTDAGTLSFSRAGHCPLLHVRAGEARFLQPEGMALGLDAGGRFADSLREESILLEPDDVVVLYTDGVTEARNAKEEEFASERLAETVARAAAHGAQAILDEILQSVHHHSARAEADDDITVLVLHWRGGV